MSRGAPALVVLLTAARVDAPPKAVGQRIGMLAEGPWLENEAVKRHRATPRHVNAYAISELEPSKTILRCASVNLDGRRGFEPDVSPSYHNHFAHLRACSSVCLGVLLYVGFLSDTAVLGQIN